MREEKSSFFFSAPARPSIKCPIKSILRRKKNDGKRERFFRRNPTTQGKQFLELAGKIPQRGQTEKRDSTERKRLCKKKEKREESYYISSKKHLSSLSPRTHTKSHLNVAVNITGGERGKERNVMRQKYLSQRKIFSQGCKYRFLYLLYSPDTLSLSLPKKTNVYGAYLEPIKIYIISPLYRQYAWERGAIHRSIGIFKM